MFIKKAIAILLACVFLKELAWATFIPLWQTPDEQAHFAQVSILSETKALAIPPMNLSSEILQTETTLGVVRDDYGNNKYTYHPEFNIPYSGSLIGPSELKLSAIPKSARLEFVRNEAAAYPPLYYVLTTPFYLIFADGSIFDRVFAVRLVNVLSMVALTLVVYKIGFLVFQKNTSALYLAILVSFLPMLSFVHAGVTSDALFILVFTLFLWRALLLIKEGISLKKLFYISVIIVAGLFTKPQANIMAFILGPLILALILFDKKNRKFLLPAIILFGLSIIGIVYRVVRGAPLIPESSSSLSFSPVLVIEHLFFTLNHTYREVLPWFWGVFRWLSLGLPDIVRKITNWLLIISFLGFCVYTFKVLKNKRVTQEFWLAAFLAFSLIVYFMAITVFDFGFRQSHGYSFGIQGRYFFPVIVPIMAIFLLGLQTLVPQKFNNQVGAFLSLLMLVFNIFVFVWLTGSYYSLSLPHYFLQASQYKPYWLKHPVNAVVFLWFIISSIVPVGLIYKNWYAKKAN